MDEEKKDITGVGQSSMPAGEAMPAVTIESQPMQTPTPAPMPMAEPTPVMQQPVEPVVQMPEPQMQQPVATTLPTQPTQPMQDPIVSQTSAPQVERMEMPMQPIDLTGQSEMPIQQMAAPEGDGDKKKLIIIGSVVVAGLLAGVIGFFVWRSMSAPAEQVPVDEQAMNIPAEPKPIEQVAIPVAPEADDISVLEQELNTFNAGSIDVELQNGLNEVNAAL